MRLVVVDTCEYCGAERISPEDCSRHFGHSSGSLVCAYCCCYGGDEVEEEKEESSPPSSTPPEQVRLTENGFVYKRSAMWRNGDEYAVLGKVLHFGGVPCVVTSFDDVEIEFAAPVGGPLITLEWFA